jgi:hypothetical protein
MSSTPLQKQKQRALERQKIREESEKQKPSPEFTELCVRVQTKKRLMLFGNDQDSYDDIIVTYV